MLKNGILKEQWGQSATNYIDDLLTDLQTTQRKRSTTMTKVLDRLRGNYAGAILTLNRAWPLRRRHLCQRQARYWVRIPWRRWCRL